MKKSVFYILDYENYLYKYKISIKHNDYIKKINNDKMFGNKSNHCNECDQTPSLCPQTKLIYANGYCLFFLLNELKISLNYKYFVTQYIKNLNHFIVIKLDTPKKEFIDYQWNEFTNRLSWEKAEVDNMMSWLSTLGGAFSALGDCAGEYANVAGKISIQQLKLAIRFGDPISVARCKLYYSISLIQKGQLKQAKCLIKQQYNFAKSQPEVDERIIRMCQGIWMKLQYSYFLRKQNRLLLSKASLNIQ